MNVHEYQAKALLTGFGVRVPRGEAVESAEDAGRVAAELATAVVVVKSQIHAGGRGAGAMVASAAEAAEVFQANRSGR